MPRHLGLRIHCRRAAPSACTLAEREAVCLQAAGEGRLELRIASPQAEGEPHTAPAAGPPPSAAAIADHDCRRARSAAHEYLPRCQLLMRRQGASNPLKQMPLRLGGQEAKTRCMQDLR